VALARKLEVSVPVLWSSVLAVGIEQKLVNIDTAERRAILAEREERKHGYARDRKCPARLQ
jgi:hypothetical protein